MIKLSPSCQWHPISSSHFETPVERSSFFSAISQAIPTVDWLLLKILRLRKRTRILMSCCTTYRSWCMSWHPHHSLHVLLTGLPGFVVLPVGQTWVSVDAWGPLPVNEAIKLKRRVQWISHLSLQGKRHFRWRVHTIQRNPIVCVYKKKILRGQSHSFISNKFRGF